VEERRPREPQPRNRAHVRVGQMALKGGGRREKASHKTSGVASEGEWGEKRGILQLIKKKKIGQSKMQGWKGRVGVAGEWGRVEETELKKRENTLPLEKKKGTGKDIFSYF